MTEFEKIYRDYFDDVFLYIKRLSGNSARSIFSQTAKIRRKLYIIRTHISPNGFGIDSFCG